MRANEKTRKQDGCPEVDRGGRAGCKATNVEMLKYGVTPVEKRNSRRTSRNKAGLAVSL